MLDYKLLEAFAVVVEAGGFEKAATRLFITQSAVSQRIKQLEELSGQPLLVRSTPPQPTEAGIQLLGHYTQVKHLEEQLSQTLAPKPRTSFLTLNIGINADSLSTWFFTAIEPFLATEKVVVKLSVDDQEQTHTLLKDGKVLGCISTREKAMQGCSVNYLGTMRYSLYCSKDFAEAWFSEGFTIETVAKAPVMSFNAKDELNEKLFTKTFGATPPNLATHYVPSPEAFVSFIKAGLTYGALPEQQIRPMAKEGWLHDLTPTSQIDVQLYYHSWNLQSKVMQGFGHQLLHGAAQLLS